MSLDSLPENIKLILTGNPPQDDYLGETNDLLVDGALQSNRLLNAHVKGLANFSLERNDKVESRVDQSKQEDASIQGDQRVGVNTGRLEDKFAGGLARLSANKFPCSDLVSNLVDRLKDAGLLNSSIKRLIVQLIAKPKVHPGKIVAEVQQLVLGSKKRFLASDKSPTDTKEQAWDKYQAAYDFASEAQNGVTTGGRNEEPFKQLVLEKLALPAEVGELNLSKKPYTFKKKGEPGSLVVQGFVRSPSNCWYCMIYRQGEEGKALAYIGGSMRSTNFGIDEYIQIMIDKMRDAKINLDKDFFRKDPKSSGTGDGGLERFKDAIRWWLENGNRDPPDESGLHSSVRNAGGSEVDGEPDELAKEAPAGGDLVPVPTNDDTTGNGLSKNVPPVLQGGSRNKMNSEPKAPEKRKKNDRGYRNFRKKMKRENRYSTDDILLTQWQRMSEKERAEFNTKSKEKKEVQPQVAGSPVGGGSTAKPPSFKWTKPRLEKLVEALNDAPSGSTTQQPSVHHVWERFKGTETGIILSTKFDDEGIRRFISNGLEKIKKLHKRGDPRSSASLQGGSPAGSA